MQKKHNRQSPVLALPQVRALRSRGNSLPCIITPPLFWNRQRLRPHDDLKATNARLRRHKLH